MPLPDPASSHAVLIGVSTYESLPSLPATSNNIEELAALLTDRDLWGLPEENCHIVPDPRSPTEVLDIVHEAVGRAEDAFLLYFAGHGLVSLRGELFLALPGTSADRLYRALPFADLRSVLLDARHAPSKVVLLDCCYSGRAMDGYMGAPGSMIERARVDGSYLMTASSETAQSWAYQGERFTAFTGELIKTLSAGIPGGPDLLEMESIYWHVRGVLEEKGRTVPQQRARNDGRKIALVRNRHRPAAVAEVGETAPASPAGHESALRGTVHDLTVYVIGLYEGGLEAEAARLLSVAGTTWPVQETAALVSRLRAADRAEAAVLVLDRVASRPAAEAVTCATALSALRADGSSDDLMRLLGRRPTAAVVQAFLAMGEHPSLRNALLVHAFEQHDPSGVAALLARMHIVPGGDEALATLIRIYDVSGRAQECLEMADHLLADGLTEQAYPLYLTVPAAISRSKSPEEIAVLLRGMGETGRRQAARQLLEEILGRESSVHRRVHLALAVHGAAVSGADDIGRLAVADARNDALRDAAQRLRMSYTTGLRTVAGWACAARGAGEVVFFTQALQETGRPLDASNLLIQEVRRRPTDAAYLISALRPSVPGAAEALLSWLVQQPVSLTAVVAAQLRLAWLTAESSRLVEAIWERPAEEVCAEAATLSDVVSVEKLLPFFRKRGSSKGLAPLLCRLWEAGRQTEADLVLDLASVGSGSVSQVSVFSDDARPEGLLAVLDEVRGMPGGSRLLAHEMPSAMPRLASTTLHALACVGHAEEARGSEHLRWINDGFVRFYAPDRLAALLHGFLGSESAEVGTWLLDLLLLSHQDLSVLLAGLDRRQDRDWLTTQVFGRGARFDPERVLALYLRLHPVDELLAESVFAGFIRQRRSEELLRDDVGLPVLAVLLALWESRRIYGANSPWEEVASQVRRYGWTSAYGGHTDVLHGAAPHLTGRDLALLMDVVPAVDATALPVLLLAQRSPDGWLPEFLSALSVQGRESHLAALLDGVGLLAPVREVAEVWQVLREEKMAAEADALVSRFGETRSFRERRSLNKLLS
ncbi:caspase family protein [Streptomyces sp. NPDC102283]|uniref:caspase, EACC1-associated type n=1 Tax=Streptomyces sp. NPDC102283 TaxID=3366155 RepID=UPI0037F53F7F